MTETRAIGETFRIALYSGLCVRHDAISASLRLKLDIIDSWSEAGLPIAATAIVHASDNDDYRVQSVSGVAELIRCPAFRTADLHVFEFGIHYPNFDAVFLLPKGTATAGIYHNVTPPELADDSGTREILERSLTQRENLSCVGEVACVSEYSRLELLNLGWAAESLSVLPLPPAIGGFHKRPPGRSSARPDTVSVLYVGRLVAAKGVLDLLEALDLLGERGRGLRLTLAGNPNLSSPHVLREIERRCDEGGSIRLVRAPDDDELHDLYAEADVFVMPSYHEGYCVPVFEALNAGCQVVAYDSTNLPFALAGLGTLVPTGDVTGLAAALAAVVERTRDCWVGGGATRVATVDGEMEETDWRERVARHLEQHSRTRYEHGFAALLRRAGGDRFAQLMAGPGVDALAAGSTLR